MKRNLVPAPAVVQTEEVPNKEQLVSNHKASDLEGNTYRTLEFSSLPPVLCNNIVYANLCTSKLLAPCFARTCHRSSTAIAIAIPVDSIAMKIIDISLNA